jgi:hypothetical protein
VPHATAIRMPLPRATHTPSQGAEP